MRSGGKPRRRAPVQSSEASPAAPPTPEQTAEPRPTEPAPAQETTASPAPVQAAATESPAEATPEPAPAPPEPAPAAPEAQPEAAPEPPPQPAPDQQRLPSFDEAELLIRVPTELLAASPEEEAAPGEERPIAIDPRQVELARFARLHLRTGLLIQARAELEELAGSDALDRDGQLDLAEIRWRTGDLGGAGMAAEAYLLAGGSMMLGYLIAAEVASERGRLADARELLGRAVSKGASNLQALFAGVPCRAEWPESVWLAPAQSFEGSAVPSLTAVIEELERPAPVEPPAEPEADEIEGFEAEALEPAAIEPEAEPVEPAVEGAQLAPETVEAASEIAPLEPVALEETVEIEEPVEGLSIETFEAEALEPEAIEPEIQPVQAEAFAAPLVEPVPAPPVEPVPVEAALLEPIAPNPWDEELAVANAALAGNDALLAALHFAVALRLSRSAAKAVLAGIGDRNDLPLLLVRLDAEKALGNVQGAGRTLAALTTGLTSDSSIARSTEPSATHQEPVVPAESDAATALDPDPDPDADPDPDSAPGQTPIRWE